MRYRHTELLINAILCFIITAIVLMILLATNVGKFTEKIFELLF